MPLTERRLRTMALQLERWSARIDRTVADVEGDGRGVAIADHLRHDELKLFRLVARARLDGYRASPPAQRESLADGLAQAWRDLSVAMRSRKRYPTARGLSFPRTPPRRPRRGSSSPSFIPTDSMNHLDGPHGSRRPTRRTTDGVR